MALSEVLSGYDLLRQVRDMQEAYLINFFGTEERARELAHLYVIEDHGSTLELGEQYKLNMTTSWRLRLKTAEELEQENN